MNLKRTSWRLAVAATLALQLAACGGGDDDDPADKYLGRWQGCLVDASGNRYRETLFIQKVTATKVVAEITQTAFTDATCSGTGGIPHFGVANYEVRGTKVIDGQTVDKIFTTQNNGERKDAFLVSGDRLRFSAENPPRDADGWPEALDPQFLVRVP